MAQCGALGLSEKPSHSLFSTCTVLQMMSRVAYVIVSEMIHHTMRYSDLIATPIQ